MGLTDDETTDVEVAVREARSADTVVAIIEWVEQEAEEQGEAGLHLKKVQG